ncbi:hypothetical protein L6164_012209 [Bauhinia variegata]|uniref:Uncharacterized protein n=1 Tax=Bauhinia variegata TaxID=167791 RepID=A0ACB9P9M7_BAUVA|nr:hypothetical protein L6164_012209 [Bauhinia variegata]
MDDFTVTLHHGGHFENGPPRRYVGGSVNHWDNCDPDRMSIPVLVDFFKSLGYISYKSCNYLITGLSLENGLVKLKNDNDIHLMVEDLKDEVVKVVDVVGAEIDDHGVQVEVDDDLEAEVNDDNAKGAEEDEVRHQDNDSSFDDYDSATDEAYKIDPYEMFELDEDGEEETRKKSYNQKAEKSKEKKGNNGDEDAEKEETRKKCSNKKSTKGKEKKYVNGHQNVEGEFSRKKGKKRQFDNGGESTSRMRLNSNIYTNPFVDNEYMTEELHTAECSDNEERAKFPQCNPNIGYGHVKFELEMEFPNLAEFKKAIKDYGIFEGRI